MIQLAYRTPQGATLFVREWVPGNPDKEILANSRPIRDQVGQGLAIGTKRDAGSAVGGCRPDARFDLYAQRRRAAARESPGHGRDLGPASNQQVFTFVVDQPTIKDVPPAPPVEIPVNAQGVQELTLVVTPGGYTPLRFAVKKGIPVKLTFRQLGQVGCGNELIFPADPQSPSSPDAGL